MEKRNKLIHRIIVVCLALVCIFMGGFEDAFVQGAFLVATIYNLVYIIFHGVDAWLNNLLVIIAAPAVVINFIFMGIYVAMKRRKDKIYCINSEK